VSCSKNNLTKPKKLNKIEITEARSSGGAVGVFERANESQGKKNVTAKGGKYTVQAPSPVEHKSHVHPNAPHAFFIQGRNF